MRISLSLSIHYVMFSYVSSVGCTPSHFDSCLFCASLHHCRPLVVNAFEDFVSVSALAMWPAHPCSSGVLSVCGSILYLSTATCPCLCISVHHSTGVVSSAFLNLALSAMILARHDVNLSCHSAASHTWPHCSCQCFHSQIEEQKYGQYNTLCHFLYFPCACFRRCCTESAEFPIQRHAIPTYIKMSIHAAFESSACN